MLNMRPRLPNAVPGDRLNVLSIDGGGVRGMIPARVLKFLEEKLNELDPTAKGHARIADYFDLIAGTSTGGILASLLATPDNNGKLRSATEICRIFLKDAEQIFPQDTIRALPLEDKILCMEKESQGEGNIKPTEQQLASLMKQAGRSTNSNPFHIAEWLWRLLPKVLKKLLSYFWLLRHPLYDGKALMTLASKHFGNKRMSETATKIFVTGFDMYRRRPITFSTFQAKHSNQNVMVKDACISTSAAPVYLPPYYFKDHNIEYNAIDGGISANNPSLVALMSLIYMYYGSENITIEDLIMGEQKMKTEEHPFPTQLLSLGCGEGKRFPYSAKENLHAWKWFFIPSRREVPLVNFLMEASADIVNVQAQLVFQFFNGSSYPNGYLRVQEYELPEKNNRMDNGEHSNMEELEKIGGDLILKNAQKVNPFTYKPEDLHDSAGKVIKNNKALKQFARSLIKERNKRLARPIYSVK